MNITERDGNIALYSIWAMITVVYVIISYVTGIYIIDNFEHAEDIPWIIKISLWVIAIIFLLISKHAPAKGASTVFYWIRQSIYICCLFATPETAASTTLMLLLSAVIFANYTRN